jgi:DNA-directed RNA polymerase specialized sigma24 family protein
MAGVLIAAKIKNKKRKSKGPFSKDYLIQALRLITRELKEKHNLDGENLNEFLQQKNLASVPVEVFLNKLGALEALVKYLKENLCMSYHQIAELIHRDDRTIWASYRAASRKMKEKMDIKGEPKMFLPISIFKNRKLTVLEAAVVYLKDKGVKYSEISRLTGRNQKNIWTIYSRAAKKQHGQKHRNI